MAFLFGRNKGKSNAELCRSTKELLNKLLSDQAPQSKVEDELPKNLRQMKLILQGTPEVESSPQQVFQLVHLLMSEDVLFPLAKSIRKLPFESRKDAHVIFSFAFRFKPEDGVQEDQEPPVVRHIFNERPEIMIALVNGYQYQESALACGLTIREALKYQSIAALILYDEPTQRGKSKGLSGVDPNVPATGQGVFWKFFDWIDQGSFEIGVDAWTTFREILTKHKKLVALFLSTNADLFVTKYNEIMLQSSSYVTKRQSLGLLSTILLERPNYNFMTRYVSSSANLKLIMTLLRDDSRMIGYEAFHVFKVFVANPNKSEPVMRILINNREKLLRFLPNFLTDRQDDDTQLMDEKAYLIKIVEQLPSSASVPTTPGAITAQQQIHQEQQAAQASVTLAKSGPGGVAV